MDRERHASHNKSPQMLSMNLGPAAPRNKTVEATASVLCLCVTQLT